MKVFTVVWLKIPFFWPRDTVLLIFWRNIVSSMAQSFLRHPDPNIIHRALENRQYCTAAFLDISQAFNKVWHEGLLYKLNTFLPDNMYRILQSYLMNTYFRTKYREAYSSPRQILAGVPQGWSTLLTYPPWQIVQLPPSLMIPLS
jgi:hypothetical protein